MKSEEKCVFALSEDKSTVIIGIPAAGWEFMKDGMTHTFDLRSIGIPMRIVLFGNKDHASIIKLLPLSKDTLDMRGLDMGFGGEK